MWWEQRNLQNDILGLLEPYISSRGPSRASLVPLDPRLIRTLRFSSELKRKKPHFSVPSSMIEAFFVKPKIQNSNSFLEDLRKINQLKDHPYQHDLDVNQPKQRLNRSKNRKL